MSCYFMSLLCRDSSQFIFNNLKNDGVLGKDINYLFIYLCVFLVSISCLGLGMGITICFEIMLEKDIDICYTKKSQVQNK